MTAGILMLLLGCGKRSGELPDDLRGITPPPNILLVIIDDVGAEGYPCYPDPGIERASLPTIEALCQRGVVFEQAWSSALCSPTRAGILTGRQAWATGIGQAMASEQYPLKGEDTLLPKLLRQPGSGMTTALIGKWHLGRAVDSPNAAGYQHFSGSLGGEVDDYFSYTKIVDGEEVPVEGYATSEVVDDASAWVTQQTGPWFLTLSFNAAHTPIHLPPDDLHHQKGLTGTSSDINQHNGDYLRAMLEALDTELGRLFEELGPSILDQTVVALVADNGSMAAMAPEIFNGSTAKGTLYQGGLHVPLVLSGPGIEEGLRIAHPVQTLDLHATFLDLAGQDPAAIEVEGYGSRSLVPWLTGEETEPVHDFLLAESFGSRVRDDWQGRAVRDARYKLIRLLDDEDQLYDLETDPYESVDLLATEGQADAKAKAAHAAMSDYLASLPELPPDEE